MGYGEGVALRGEMWKGRSIRESSLVLGSPCAHIGKDYFSRLLSSYAFCCVFAIFQFKSGKQHDTGVTVT